MALTEFQLKLIEDFGNKVKNKDKCIVSVPVGGGKTENYFTNKWYYQMWKNYLYSKSTSTLQPNPPKLFRLFQKLFS